MVATKRAIPLATRRCVALAAGAVPGERTAIACHYCGAAGSAWWPRLASGRPGAWVSFTDLELDHVVPEVHGGLAHGGNIVLACRPCNRSKRDRTPEQWGGRTR